MRPIRLFLLALLLTAPALHALDVPPPPPRWYNDPTGLLNPSDAAALDRKLEAFEQRSGAQFIVYVLPSLEGDSLEDFSIRAVEKWKVGQAKYDNGLVLLVFVQDKKMRIETGRGLQGSVTDALASRVIRETIGPRFSQQDYAGGLNAGVDALIAFIEKGEAPVAPMQRPTSGQPQQTESSETFDWVITIIVLFVVFFILPAMRGGRRRGGCGGCMMPMFFLPGGGGGITFGGSGGGFGGGGGGFSGGGGSFDGGGASGGW